jgi:DNA-binding transcriptional LysR family regulator
MFSRFSLPDSILASNRRFCTRGSRLSASYDLVDIAERRFDLAIRFGDGDYPGLRIHRLGLEEVFAVCSPALAL